MAQMFAHYRVRDYEAWRPIYDGNENSRTAAGITNGRVFRGTDDPCDLVIIHDVADLEKARAWSQSAELQSTLHRAGMLGPSSIHVVG